MKTFEHVETPIGARELAVSVAREAGALLRERLGQARAIDYKGIVDLVTDADRASEALIAARLGEAFPAHRLIGEEGTRGASTPDGATASRYGWVFDPLDGTTNYAHGYPHFAVSIALEHDGAALLGVVYDPMREECFVAERGRGAELNGRPLTVSTVDELIRSLLATGFPYDIARRTETSAIWDVLLNASQGTRRDGSAALNLCYVAAGRFDGFWERPLNAWDIAAGALIVSEAGGAVTAYDGGAFDAHAGEVVATNGLIHAQLLTVIGAVVAGFGASPAVPAVGALQ